MRDPAGNDREPLARRVAVVAPWNFYPRSFRSWFRYWRPRRITGSWRERHVYRWLVFNIAPKGLPR